MTQAFRDLGVLFLKGNYFTCSITLASQCTLTIELYKETGTNLTCFLGMFTVFIQHSSQFSHYIKSVRFIRQTLRILHETSCLKRGTTCEIVHVSSLNVNMAVSERLVNVF